MLAKGLPETDDDAHEIVTQTASIDLHAPVPAHWPHSQIVSLARLVVRLENRVRELETRGTQRRQRQPQTDDENS